MVVPCQLSACPGKIGPFIEPPEYLQMSDRLKKEASVKADCWTFGFSTQWTFSPLCCIHWVVVCYNFNGMLQKYDLGQFGTSTKTSGSFKAQHLTSIVGLSWSSRYLVAKTYSIEKLLFSCFKYIITKPSNLRWVTQFIKIVLY